VSNKPRGPKTGSISETRAENELLKEQVTQLREALAAEKAKCAALRSAVASAQSVASRAAPLLNPPFDARQPSAPPSSTLPASRPPPDPASKAFAALPGSLMKLEPLHPTADETLFLETFFSYIVRNFPIVDKAAFFAALKRSGELSGAVTVSIDTVGARTKL
jgi:hypothetical protein